MLLYEMRHGVMLVLPVRFSLSITVPALMLFVAVAIAIGRSLLIISSTIRFKKINYSRTFIISVATRVLARVCVCNLPPGSRRLCQLKMIQYYAYSLASSYHAPRSIHSTLLEYSLVLSY